MTPSPASGAARILAAALELFSSPGGGGATARDVAAAAGTSPALVIKHYGSMAGLRSAADAFAADAVTAALASLASQDVWEAERQGSLASALLEHLPADSPVPRYLLRMLVDGGEAGAALFAAILDAGVRNVEAMAESGLLELGDAPRDRGLVLTSHDLAVLLLREPLAAALGDDPLRPDGAERWGRQLVDIYAGLDPRSQKGHP